MAVASRTRAMVSPSSLASPLFSASSAMPMASAISWPLLNSMTARDPATFSQAVMASSRSCSWRSCSSSPKRSIPCRTSSNNSSSSGRVHCSDWLLMWVLLMSTARRAGRYESHACVTDLSVGILEPVFRMMRIHRLSVVVFREGEVRYRITKITDEFSQVGHRFGSFAGTLGRLNRNVANAVHQLCDLGCVLRLVLGLTRDVLNQPGEIVGYGFDRLERLTGILGQSGTGDHLRGGLFHGVHGFGGVGLNGLDQRFDSPRRVGGAFGQSLDFVGDDRETTTGAAGGGGLNRRVQGEHVGLFGNAVDQFDDVPDF